MSDIKLFRIDENSVTQLEPKSATLEREVQRQIEKHLKELLSIQFLETEYSTGSRHGGRIDTLGIDENGCPVIIEYKRSQNENVINQGLYYLDWLLDHKAEFQLLVMKKLDGDAADKIDWSSPRLLCIAGEFTKYDIHAVEQINRNIELIRYSYYSDDLLLFDLVKATSSSTTEPSKSQVSVKTVTENFAQANQFLKDLYEAFQDFALSLSEEVQVHTLKHYFAFKRIRNFACVELRPGNQCLLVFLNLKPDSVKLENGFSRDVTGIGHHDTGNLELTIKSQEDLEKAKPLIVRSHTGI